MTLEVRALSIGHGGTAIGSGLSLAVGTGEILCLLGPNGCGKTTLFRTLMGLLPALSGEVLLGGRPISACRAACQPSGSGLVRARTHTPPLGS